MCCGTSSPACHPPSAPLSRQTQTCSGDYRRIRSPSASSSRACATEDPQGSDRTSEAESPKIRTSRPAYGWVGPSAFPEKWRENSLGSSEAVILGRGLCFILPNTHKLNPTTHLLILSAIHTAQPNVVLLAAIRPLLLMTVTVLAW